MWYFKIACPWYFMSDETPPRSAQSAHGPGHSRGDSGDESPLQARAAFLQNRSWESVVSFNRGTCERGGAQHGFNSESYSAVEIQWNEWRKRECTLIELLDFLRGCHRKCTFPFLQREHVCRNWPTDHHLGNGGFACHT